MEPLSDPSITIKKRRAPLYPGFSGAGGVLPPDAISYDLRDSFAAHVGRSVRARSGRVGEARDVARRLLGHGDGGDVLSRYWDDDERHQELDEYSPLRLVVRKNGGTPAESGSAPLENGSVTVETGGPSVEIGGLEPRYRITAR